MPRHPRVPDELAHGPFRGSWAVGAGLLTKYQLRSRAWVRVFRDVYLARPLGDDDGMRLAALRVATPPGTIVSGLTAAWLHRAWSPPPGQVVPLEITRPVRAPGTPIAGLHRRRLVLRGTPDLVRPEVGLSELDRDVVICGDVHATSPVRTCFDLMRDHHLVEAVAVADAFVDGSGVQIPVLDAYCADRRRWPNVRLARAAVTLASPGVRSPGESRLRMVVVLAGFSEPLVNVAVVDSADEHLATPDLLLHRRRLVGLEYDGAYHEDADQQASDRRRTNRIVAGSSIPLLRYDRTALRSRRPLIVGEVAAATGERPLHELEDRDFLRGRSRRTA